MRRPTIPTFLAAGAALVATAVLSGCCYRDSRWTTGSAEAREAFELCLEAQMKFYIGEALEHCSRALELDPEFAAAKVRVAYHLQSLDPVRSQELFDELRETDLERLNHRERFLVRYFLAVHDDHPEDTAETLGNYLDKHPEDPFAVSILCARSWMRQQWDEAEACYRRLLEVDPNWVIAQNNLGYIAMARGKFGEAEEHFETYRYIAPDQANPHDSMGELLILIGRYDEAERELEQALEIRPDFCASYEHLVRLAVMRQRFDDAREALERREEQPLCRGEHTAEFRCSIDIWSAIAASDWEAVWEVGQGECSGKGEDVILIAHSAAANTGRTAAALELEAKVEKMLADAGEYDEMGEVNRDGIEAMLAHMQATRLLAGGRAGEAAEKFATADRLLRYWVASGLSVFKLFNQLGLAQALGAAGNREGQEAVLRRLRSVNPQIEKVWGSPPPPP